VETLLMCVWASELDAVHGRFVHRFSRSEPRESALLIAPLERKNGWTLAEEAGHAGPDRIQRMLNRIKWDAEEVLDDVRRYVVDHLGDTRRTRTRGQGGGRDAGHI